MNNNLQIARIWQQDPVHANAIGDIYVCQNQELIRKNGLLFILININNPHSDYDQFIGALIERLENIYYYCPLEDSTKILESTLSELNAWLPNNLPNDKKIIQNLDLLIGNYKDELINFAYLGNWQGYLVNKFKAIDIIGSEKTTINPVKIFQNIITGKVEKGFSLLITQPSLLDYIALEKIRKIISTIPAASASEQIKNMISNVGPRISFLGLIVKQLTAEAEAITPSPIQNLSAQQYQQWNNQFNTKGTKQSKESLDNLLATQKETQKIMTQPSSWQTLALLANNMMQRFIVNSFWPWFKKILEQLWQAIRNGGLALFNLSHNLLNLLIQQLSRIKYFSVMKSRIRFSLPQTKLGYRKIIIIVIILLIPLFFIIINTQQKGLSDQQLTDLKNNINQKSQEIESALIYGNRDQAKKIWQELKDLQQQLVTTTNSPETATMMEQIKILTDRIWSIRTLEQTKIVWAQDPNQTAVRGLTKSGDYLLAWLEINGYWRIDLKDSKNNKYFSYPEGFAGWKMNGYLPNGQPLIIDLRNNFYSWQNDELQKISITLSSGTKEITSLDSYNNRLYIFDRGNQQIYRYQQSGNFLNNANIWLKDNIALQDFQSLAIDGNLYLAKNNEILVLNNGRNSRSLSIGIQPLLSNSLQLYTKQDFLNLYLLDTETNRLIVLKKDGELINQYQSSSFTQLKQALILEKEQKAYLLNGQQILEINIEKIK